MNKDLSVIASSGMKITDKYIWKTAANNVMQSLDMIAGLVIGCFLRIYANNIV